MEDVDLGFRLRLLGHQSLYVPNAVVEHVGSGITGRRSDFSVYFGHRNLVWTYFKNMPSALLYRYLLLHLVVNTMAIARYTRRGQGGVVLKAKRDGFGGLKAMLRSRREVQLSRIVSNSELLQSMSTGYSALVGR
jgi:GT2 family glycosyltransferase